MTGDATLVVYGHDWAQRLLRSAVMAGRSAHAYLITGPEQIGKSTLARAFAQALCCEAPQDKTGLGACGHCRACRLVHDGSYPDLRLVEPVNDQIRIEQVRDLIREAALSPTSGRHKVFVVPSFERANANAANALLKTLEEPTETTRILLTSNEAAGLLPTITSRCQIVALRSLPADEVAASLQAGWGAPPERARLLAGLSGGRLGWAINTHEQPGLWDRQQSHLDDTIRLVHEGVVKRLEYAARLAEGEDVQITLRSWMFWWRDVLMLQRGCDDLVVNGDRLAQLQTMAARLPEAEVRRYLQALMTSVNLLRLTVSVPLALENLLLKMPVPA